MRPAAWRASACVSRTNADPSGITAAVQSGSGADIFNFQYNWPHLYQNAVVDVSDVAADLAKAGPVRDRYIAALREADKRNYQPLLDFIRA